MTLGWWLLLLLLLLLMWLLAFVFIVEIGVKHGGMQPFH